MTNKFKLLNFLPGGRWVLKRMLLTRGFTEEELLRGRNRARTFIERGVEKTDAANKAVEMLKEERNFKANNG